MPRRLLAVLAHELQLDLAEGREDMPAIGRSVSHPRELQLEEHGCSSRNGAKVLELKLADPAQTLVIEQRALREAQAVLCHGPAEKLSHAFPALCRASNVRRQDCLASLGLAVGHLGFFVLDELLCVCVSFFVSLCLSAFFFFYTAEGGQPAQPPPVSLPHCLSLSLAIAPRLRLSSVPVFAGLRLCLCLRLSVCVCVCVCVSVCLRLSASASTCASLPVFVVCVRVCVLVCLLSVCVLCRCVRMSLCFCVSVFLCICVSVRLCFCVSVLCLCMCVCHPCNKTCQECILHLAISEMVLARFCLASLR